MRKFIAGNIRAGQLLGELRVLAGDRFDVPALTAQLRTVHKNVRCAHDESHLLEFVVELARLSPAVPGVIVEAGCFKGGGSAKISLVAEKLDRSVHLYDSFEGLPSNDEPHGPTLSGGDVTGWFRSGQFAGTLDEVQANIGRWGVIERCRFIPGWFEETMPLEHEPIAAAYLDVDLADSTRTCLRYLWPRLSPGGVLMSQDGEFPLVVEVFRDKDLWRELGTDAPVIDGLGKSKMLRVVKR